MPNQFSFLDTLLIIGLIQGLASCALLWFSSNNRKHNQLLALALLFLSVGIFKMLQHTLGFWDYPNYRYAPLAFDLTTAPFFYLFIMSFIGRPLKRWWLHLIPTALFLVHAILVYVDTLQTTNFALKETISQAWLYNEVKKIDDLLVVPISITYLILALKEINRFKKNYDLYPKMQQSIRWIQRGFLLMIGLTISGVLLVSVEFMNIPTSLHYYAYYGFSAIVIYYWGFTGYRQAQLPEFKIPARKVSEQKFKSFYPKIIQAIEGDQFFLDPELKLASFSKQLGINSAELSQMIKLKTGKSFRDFINHYRVEAVKEKLLDEQLTHLSILGIALECGFNSEASFYRVFKSVVGQSPADFRRMKNS